MIKANLALEIRKLIPDNKDFVLIPTLALLSTLSLLIILPPSTPLILLLSVNTNSLVVGLSMVYSIETSDEAIWLQP